MKLSFSTNRWKNTSMADFFAMAKEYRFSGVEIHSIRDFGEKECSALYHEANALRLSIACLDMGADIGADADAAREELDACISAAQRLHTPYLRLRAEKGEDAVKKSEAFLAYALPKAKEASLTLLIETVGAYADTGVLADTLRLFADDSLGALWDVYYPYMEMGESAEATIRNLGA